MSAPTVDTADVTAQVTALATAAKAASRSLAGLSTSAKNTVLAAAAAAVEALIRRMSARGEPRRRVVFNVELISRDSVRVLA